MISPRHRTECAEEKLLRYTTQTRTSQNGRLRTREEVDQVICWLTGYDADGLRDQLDRNTDFRSFFAEAPAYQPKSDLITGVICGVRVENIEDPLMKKIRQMDKLVDELAKGKAIQKVLRQ